ncbi:hypothetical protein DAI22_04g061301 [Oryza sativa Japonica Group]|nr:hypothetical protein DAI22_04g061301 [Oryza sativa Japonica Group]
MATGLRPSGATTPYPPPQQKKSNATLPIPAHECRFPPSPSPSPQRVRGTHRVSTHNSNNHDSKPSSAEQEEAAWSSTQCAWGRRSSIYWLASRRRCSTDGGQNGVAAGRQAAQCRGGGGMSACGLQRDERGKRRNEEGRRLVRT